MNHRFEPHITVQQFVTKLHHRYQFISRSVAVKCRRGWHHQHGSLWLHFLHSYAIPYQVLMCNVYASTWRQTDVTTTQLPYTSLSLSFPPLSTYQQFPHMSLSFLPLSTYQQLPHMSLSFSPLSTYEQFPHMALSFPPLST